MHRERSGALLTIDLAAIAANYRLLREKAGDALCAGVVKADAYGMGMDEVAPVLWAEGCRWFFVARIEEAVRLRALLPEAGIAVLNGLAMKAERIYSNNHIIPVLNSLEELHRWRGLAHTLGQSMPAILHVDTGMNRLGLGPDELELLALTPDRLAGIDLRFVLSHLACADDANHPLNAKQRERFVDAIRRLSPKGSGIKGTLANSSGLFLGPDYHFDMVRSGGAIYGVNPTPNVENPMRRVVSLGGRVLQVRAVDSSMTVGYGAAHRVARKGRLATVAVGYADGFPRSLGGTGYGYVGNVRVPIVGRVSMDLVTVDITSLPEGTVAPGSFVELVGPHASVDEVAHNAGTIAYEILTSIGSRHYRNYIMDEG